MRILGRGPSRSAQIRSLRAEVRAQSQRLAAVAEERDELRDALDLASGAEPDADVVGVDQEAADLQNTLAILAQAGGGVTHLPDTPGVRQFLAHVAETTGIDLGGFR